MTSLPRIRPGLLRHSLEQQVLVYDPRAQQVHLLDPTTGFVLELLEKGGYDSERIALELAERTGLENYASLLPLAVEELRRAHLLDETVISIAPLPEVSRREAVRSLALTGAAAVLLPGIATLIPTRTYAQGTAAAGGVGTACNSDSQCASGNCCGEPTGVCASTTCPQPPGEVCTAGNQCLSGNCIGGFCGPLRIDHSSCSSSAQCLSNQCCYASSASVGTATCKVSTCAPGDNVAGSGGCTGNNTPAYPLNTCCSGNCSPRSGGPGARCTDATCLP